MIVHTHTHIYICIYIYIYISSPGVIPNTQKIVLDAALLSSQH